MAARAVVVKGRLGETERTRSARTANLNVVLKKFSGSPICLGFYVLEMKKEIPRDI